MKTTRLGSGGPTVSSLGLGCMGISGTYGFYEMGHNELLIAEALQGRKRDDVPISVKFGAQRGPDRSLLGYDARPAAVKTALAYSLQRLRTDRIDIYRPARLDPNVPIEDTVGAIGELIDAGYVRYVGLSEVGVETIRRAATIRPICDLQIEYSLLSRRIEEAILPTCRELGIAVTAYGVLSRGLIGGSYKPNEGSGNAHDVRTRFPRFQGENLRRNLGLVEQLRSIAEPKGVSAAQVAFAWVLSRGEDIVPLVGARRREHLRDAVSALGVELNASELERIEQVVPAHAVVGERYATPQMANLDSER
jgi:aryl-alcohol dehydrogenase-like predicted oxidoreductase